MSRSLSAQSLLEAGPDQAFVQQAVAQMPAGQLSKE